MSKYPSPYKHIILAQQFTPDFIFELFNLAEEIRNNPKDFEKELSGKVVSTLFYEPSTRTRLSFESAATRLGAFVITTENAREFSSATKGETIEDTISVISKYCDFIVLRHFEDDSSKRAVSTTTVPIINAGSGKSQHPTQALLDVYTIWREFGRLENLNIAIVGDLLRGRTCDSLVYLLSKFKGNSFSFVAPENCRVKESLKKHLIENSVYFNETSGLQDVLNDTDVLYMTRIQKERFEDVGEYEKAKGEYVVNNANIERMKKNSIVMHPLPRIDEINKDVDNNPRAKYFEQALNGLWIRMALLKILNDKH